MLWAMVQIVLRHLVLASLVVATVGCGQGATSGLDGRAGEGDTAQASGGEAPPEVSGKAAMGKLDAVLQAEVTAPGRHLLAVKVVFKGVPDKALLRSLMLVSSGGLVIGRVSKEDLLVLAKRPDVLQIEHLSDAGYSAAY